MNIENSRNVFIYWVGIEYSLIQLLRKLIIKHSSSGIGYNLHFITKININEYIDNLPLFFYELQPAHQADFIRVMVICKYGGIWLDSDILVIESLDSLFDIIENQNGFFITENNIDICNGVFGSKKNTQLMVLWKNNMLKILNEKKNNIKWTEIGSSIIKQIIKNNQHILDDYKVFNGLNTMYPVNWNKCVKEFILKPYSNYKNIEFKFQPLIILVNSVYKKLNKYNEEQIINMNIPLTYFIKKSFNNLKN